MLESTLGVMRMRRIDCGCSYIDSVVEIALFKFNPYLNFVHNLERGDFALTVHIEAFVDRIEVHQLDFVGLDLAFFQP